MNVPDDDVRMNYQARPSFRQHDSSSHEAADHQLGDSLHFISPGPSFHDVAECLIGSGFWSRLFDILFLVGRYVYLCSGFASDCY